MAFPDGVTVAKPTATPSNSVPGLDGACAAEDVPIDAPCVYLHTDGRKWIVTLCDYVPSPGRGDFVNEWTSADKAIADILDFYLGDDARMKAKFPERF